MKTFCICLPESPQRIEKARAHFAERGLTDVDFFYGIHAGVAGLATSHVFELDHPNSGFKIGPAPTGCWLSHYMLWNTLTRLPDEHVLVLEDDVELDVDFVEQFERALVYVPQDFDLLYVGSCCVGGHRAMIVGPRAVETKHVQCTHAYVIAKKCLPFLLRTFRKVWAPIDIQLQLEALPHLKSYAVIPRIAGQFNTELPP